MKRIKQYIGALLIALSLGVATVPVPAQAINVFNQCAGNTSAVCTAATKDSAPDMVKTVINTLLYILGMIAVIMIVVGGIRYTLSAGDSGAVTAAKNTVLYAVVGLVVAILAFVIVNFVITAFK